MTTFLCFYTKISVFMQKIGKMLLVLSIFMPKSDMLLFYLFSLF